MTKTVWMLALIAALPLGCGKKKDKTEAGGGGGGGGESAEYQVPDNLAGLEARADYKQLMKVADEGLAAEKATQCDTVNAKGKEAVALLVKLVPGYGAIADAAEKDKALVDRMGDLNALRATLEMATEGYDKDATEHATDAGGAGMDMREHYCKAIAEDLAKARGAK